MPTHRDALAAEVVVVLPCGGVEDGALEALEPGKVRDLRLMRAVRLPAISASAT